MGRWPWEDRMMGLMPESDPVEPLGPGSSKLETRTSRLLKEPEYRALEQIVADAEAAGVPVVALGPAGIIEITGPGTGRIGI